MFNLQKAVRLFLCSPPEAEVPSLQKNGLSNAVIATFVYSHAVPSGIAVTAVYITTKTTQFDNLSIFHCYQRLLRLIACHS